MGDLVVNLKNDLAELDRLARLTAEFGQQQHWPARAIYAVNLALEELFTNQIAYGYDDHAEHQVRIEMSFAAGGLTIRMIDDGRPFNPLERAEPTLDRPLEDREIGGLGIFLVRKTMEHLEYHRRDGQNILIMKKNIIPEIAHGNH